MSSYALDPQFPFRSRYAPPAVADRRLDGGQREARLRAAVAHAQAGDGRARAFALLAPDDALRAEAALGRQAAGPPGLLEGVPFAAKALFAAAGMPAAPGTRLPVPDMPADAGPALAALQAAGALLVGKTRTTEFALGNLNLSHPTPVNPLPYPEPAATGGSSNGSASAVGAGLVPLALGTDTGGSVRVPAALCGVVGYKSTPALLPCAGVYPLSPALDSVGVLARDLDHAELAFRAMTGREVPALALAGLRLGVCDTLCSDLDQPVDHAWRRVLAGLLRAGVTLAPIDLPGLDRMPEIYAELVPYQLCEHLGKAFLKRHYDLLDPVAQARLRPALAMPKARAAELLALRRELAGQAAAALHGLDGWISPATPCLAPALSALREVDAVARFNGRVSTQARPVNVYDQCAVVLPARWADTALPVGVQVVAAHGEDVRALAMARALTRLCTEA